MAEAEARAHVIVRGRVQGVGFRWHTCRTARSLGVSGWVANLDDGRVEVCVQGDAPALDALIDWLRRGPTGARVDHALVEREPDALTLAPHHARMAW